MQYECKFRLGYADYKSELNPISKEDPDPDPLKNKSCSTFFYYGSNKYTRLISGSGELNLTRNII